MVHIPTKALTLSAALVLGSLALSAQDVPPPPPPAPESVREASDSTKAKAGRMAAEIAAAVAEFSKDMAALEQQIKDKDISKEDAERRRKELSDRLEARLEAIEEMAEAWADDLEESIENLELNLGDNLKLNIEPSEPKKKKLKRKQSGMQFLLGTNTLLNMPYSGSGSLDLYEGPWLTDAVSSTFNFTFTTDRRIARSPIWYRTGWGVTSYTYNFGQNTVLNVPSPQNPDFSITASNEPLRRSRLNMSYLEVPLAISIDPSRRGKGIRLTAGGFAGIRLNGNRQIAYRSEGMGRVFEDTNGQFYGSLFSYGLSAELGYRRFAVGVRQNFNKPFNEAVLPTNIQSDAQPNFYNASVFASVRLF
ncbi:MAG: hypothetical protein ACO30N_03585 [Schleiferiaceae bacterium]